MKIAAPWPVDETLHPRLQTAIKLWKDPSILVFFSGLPIDNAKNIHHAVLLERDSSAIGGKNRPFVYDMLNHLVEEFPEEDWYGFMNSDCVGVRDLIEDAEDSQVLMFHRTDIPNWNSRLDPLAEGLLSQDVFDLIARMQSSNSSNEEIARKLNRLGVISPTRHSWTSRIIDDFVVQQGKIYHWGIDLFLFRKDVVQEVLNNYLKISDPIMGVRGYDQPLEKWCNERFRTKKQYHRLFHCVHSAGWTTNDPEYEHNTKGCEIFGQTGCDFVNVPQPGRIQRLDVPSLVEDGMAFITLEKLTRSSEYLATILPPDIDAIVGVARSGMIPASILACQLHLPLFCVSDTTGVWDCGHGSRIDDHEQFQTVLLVDDTVFLGRAMKRIKPKVQEFFHSSRILTAGIYANPKGKHCVDFIACELPEPHYLEWNMFNAFPCEKSAFDMDGIICQEINPKDDDDGSLYLHALRNVLPKYLPRRKSIPLVVTARLEKYRYPTMEWLERHKVKVNKLVMGPWSTLSERNKPNRVAQFKAEHYAESNCHLFIESCPMQAEYIANITGKRVLCPAAGRCFG